MQSCQQCDGDQRLEALAIPRRACGRRLPSGLSLAQPLLIGLRGRKLPRHTLPGDHQPRSWPAGHMPIVVDRLLADLPGLAA